VELPDPEPGLVIRYSYLWHDDARRGREEGIKDRPCAIVLATRRSSEERMMVIVAPITHTPPRDETAAIPLPLPVKRRLGLDEAPSWIVTDDVNVFAWPGPDLRPVDRSEDGRLAYGFLPRTLTEALIAAVRDHARRKQIKQMPRLE